MDYLKIEDHENNLCYYFKCDEWFSSNSKDQKTTRTLFKDSVTTLATKSSSSSSSSSSDSESDHEASTTTRTETGGKRSPSPTPRSSSTNETKKGLTVE